MNYYRITAKCGHVGKNSYVIKNLYVRAESKKEAAKLARDIPRVKHHHKDAIRSVEEITLAQYRAGRAAQREDPYFCSKNKQEQNANCFGLDELIRPEEKPKRYKKKTHARKRLIERRKTKEWIKERNESLYE